MYDLRAIKKDSFASLSSKILDVHRRYSLGSRRLMYPERIETLIYSRGFSGGKQRYSRTLHPARGNTHALSTTHLRNEEYVRSAARVGHLILVRSDSTPALSEVSATDTVIDTKASGANNFGKYPVGHRSSIFPSLRLEWLGK